MKIISKFKDYYDSGAVYGIDENIKYIRKHKELDLPTYKSHYGREIYINSTYDILGFCGEIFLLKNYSRGRINVWKYDPKKYILWNEDARDYEYDIVNEYTNSEYLKKVKVGELYYMSDYKELKENKILKDLFYKYKIPIYFIGNIEGKEALHLNPKLKNFAFAKFYDTTQAFQRVQQFLSNELVIEFQPDIPVGGNEVLGRSKGFDEYSFRHINTKKKPKKF